MIIRNNFVQHTLYEVIRNSETKKYQPLGFRIKKLDGLVVKKSYPDNKNEQNNYYNLDHGIEVFNIVERLPHKQSLLAYIV